ncbi:MAG: hypothetical protein ABI041_01345 [Bdellovibrionia bacterium]
MITKNNLIEFVLKLEPDFLPALERERREFSGNEITIGLEFIAFSNFVSDKLELGIYKNAKKVFEGIEHLLTKGVADEEIQTLATTCFLENIQNLSGHGRFPETSFIPFLGPESRKFCKALDEFWGTKTPGLHDDDK